MTLFDLQEQLRATGAYATPPSPWRVRLPPGVATPLFHTRLLGIFIRGNLKARFGNFDTVAWGHFCLRMLHLTESLGGEVVVSGFDRVRDLRRPVVWVSNHVSPLETYLLPLVLTSFTELAVILKESLARYPIFGKIVQSIHPIRVGRKSPLEDLRKVLTEGAQCLRDGRSVLVFPQGQRLPLFDPATFNSMGVKLAQRAAAPVVPIAVRTDYLRLGKLHKDLVSVHTDRPVRLACGEPLSPDLSPREIQDASTAFIAGKLAEWERESGTPLLLPVANPGAATGNEAGTLA